MAHLMGLMGTSLAELHLIAKTRNTMFVVSKVLNAVAGNKMLLKKQYLRIEAYQKMEHICAHFTKLILLMVHVHVQVRFR